MTPCIISHCSHFALYFFQISIFFAKLRVCKQQVSLHAINHRHRQYCVTLTSCDIIPNARNQLSVEDKGVIKFLGQNKCYGAKRFISRIPREKTVVDFSQTTDKEDRCDWNDRTNERKETAVHEQPGRWLHTSTTRPRFDCNSTALRPHDGLRHDRAAARRSK